MHPSVKLILSFLAGVYYWRSLTPPNPPAASKEKISTDGLFGRTIRSSAVLAKSAITSANLCQIAVIISLYYPTYFSKSRLSPDFILAHICPAIESATTSKFSIARGIATISPEFVLGVALVISMGSLRLWCFRTLAENFTFEISIQKSHKLVRAGPYGYVRHPGYIAQILVMVGSFLMHLSRGSWVSECAILNNSLGFWLVTLYLTLSSISIVSLWRRGALEDVELKKVFGEEWISYRQEVPYKLIPGIA